MVDCKGIARLEWHSTQSLAVEITAINRNRIDRAFSASGKSSVIVADETLDHLFAFPPEKREYSAGPDQGGALIDVVVTSSWVVNPGIGIDGSTCETPGFAFHQVVCEGIFVQSLMPPEPPIDLPAAKEPVSPGTRMKHDHAGERPEFD